VLFVITSELFVRNYIDSNVLLLLMKRFELTLLVRRDLLGGVSVKDVNVVGYDGVDLNKSSHQVIFDLFMYRFRGRSKTFQFRYDRLFGYSDRPAASMVRLLYRIVRSLYFRVRFYLIGRLFFGSSSSYYISRLRDNPGMAQVLDSFAPDLVVIPSSAYDPDSMDCMLLCEKLNIKTLLLVDNWDNLSSKSLLWVKPDHVAVWGSQSAMHAERIQGFLPDQISAIGTPRFDKYFELRDERLSSHFDFPYILFVGTALSFNEAEVLHSIDMIMSTNGDLFGDAKVVYRPHPWRQGRDSIEGMELRNIVLDPQVRDVYFGRSHSVSFQPSLEYYPALISNAEFVVGGLTSMLIEATVFRKRFLGLVYDDGVSFANQKSVYRRYEHFVGIDRLPNLSLCTELSELESDFIGVWDKRKNIDPLSVDQELREFLFFDNHSYQERLLSLCADLMGVA